jgi:hypothetical protein
MPDLARSQLGLAPPMVVQECMANRIIEATLAGERDLKRLRDAALGTTEAADAELPPDLSVVST